MGVSHNGFTFTCDGYCSSAGFSRFVSSARTERTAIAKAREEGWFIGNVRITSGMPRSKVRTVRRVLGPCCKWLVGA